MSAAYTDKDEYEYELASFRFFFGDDFNFNWKELGMSPAYRDLGMVRWLRLTMLLPRSRLRRFATSPRFCSPSDLKGKKQ